MANPADNVTFNPKPILVGVAWALVATHALSGQREHIIGFHSETEAEEWLASKGCKAWLRTRGYVNRTPAFATPGQRESKMRHVRCHLIYVKAACAKALTVHARLESATSYFATKNYLATLDLSRAALTEPSWVRS